MKYWMLVAVAGAVAGAVGALALTPRKVGSDTAINWCEVRRLENEHCNDELTPDEMKRCLVQMAGEGLRLKAGIPEVCLDKNTDLATKVSE